MDRRCETKRVHQDLTRGFGGDMACHHRFSGLGAHSQCAERRRRADKPVDHRRHAGGRRAEIRPAHGGKVKPADFCENVHGIVRIRPIERDGLFDHRTLAGKPLVRKPRAPAGYSVGIKAEQNGDDRGGGGGVADAHFAGEQDIRPGLGALRMAGPRLISAVPFRMRRSSTPG